MVSVPKLVRSFGSDGEVVAPWQMFVLLEVWVVPGKKGGWEFCKRALTNLLLIVSAYGSLR